MVSEFGNELTRNRLLYLPVSKLKINLSWVDFTEESFIEYATSAEEALWKIAHEVVDLH